MKMKESKVIQEMVARHPQELKGLSTITLSKPVIREYLEEAAKVAQEQMWHDPKKEKPHHLQEVVVKYECGIVDLATYDKNTDTLLARGCLSYGKDLPVKSWAAIPGTEKIFAPMVVNRGEYDHSKFYHGSIRKVDVVRYNGKYYAAKEDAGIFSSVTPGHPNKWKEIDCDSDDDLYKRYRTLR